MSATRRKARKKETSHRQHKEVGSTTTTTTSKLKIDRKARVEKIQTWMMMKRKKRMPPSIGTEPKLKGCMQKLEVLCKRFTSKKIRIRSPRICSERTKRTAKLASRE